MLQTQRFCKLCNRRTLPTRTSLGFGWGCLLSILTLGIFIPIWIIIKVGEAIVVPWRCQQCGQGKRL